MFSIVNMLGVFAFVTGSVAQAQVQFGAGVYAGANMACPYPMAAPQSLDEELATNGEYLSRQQRVEKIEEDIENATDRMEDAQSDMNDALRGMSGMFQAAGITEIENYIKGNPPTVPPCGGAPNTANTVSGNRPLTIETPVVTIGGVPTNATTFGDSATVNFQVNFHPPPGATWTTVNQTLNGTLPQVLATVGRHFSSGSTPLTLQEKMTVITDLATLATMVRLTTDATERQRLGVEYTRLVEVAVARGGVSAGTYPSWETVTGAVSNVERNPAQVDDFQERNLRTYIAPFISEFGVGYGLSQQKAPTRSIASVSRMPASTNVDAALAYVRQSYSFSTAAVVDQRGAGGNVSATPGNAFCQGRLRDANILAAFVSGESIQASICTLPPGVPDLTNRFAQGSEAIRNCERAISRLNSAAKRYRQQSKRVADLQKKLDRAEERLQAYEDRLTRKWDRRADRGGGTEGGFCIGCQIGRTPSDAEALVGGILGVASAYGAYSLARREIRDRTALGYPSIGNAYAYGAAFNGLYNGVMSGIGMGAYGCGGTPYGSPYGNPFGGAFGMQPGGFSPISGGLYPGMPGFGAGAGFGGPGFGAGAGFGGPGFGAGIGAGVGFGGPGFGGGFPGGFGGGGFPGGFGGGGFPGGFGQGGFPGGFGGGGFPGMGGYGNGGIPGLGGYGGLGGGQYNAQYMQQYAQFLQQQAQQYSQQVQEQAYRAQLLQRLYSEYERINVQIQQINSGFYGGGFSNGGGSGLLPNPTPAGVLPYPGNQPNAPTPRPLGQ